MKIVLILLALCALAVAQKTTDADNQKLIDIEQKFAATTSFNSPEMTDLLQKHLYDGTTSVIGPFGYLYHNPKPVVLDFTKKPDPVDPEVKSVAKLSDFQVDIYGDTALVSYKQVSSDSGHKLPALNGDYTCKCLDTFVKRKREWYAVGSACVPSAPFSESRWDATHQMEELGKQQQKPSAPQ